MNTIAESLTKRRPSYLSLTNKQWIFLSISLFTAAIVFAYNPVFSHQFQMHWDDQWVVVNFYTENGLTMHNLREIFTQYYHGQYSPIAQLSYTLLYAAAGSVYEPGWFHTYSLIVHLLNVVLTYLFIRNLLTYSKNFTDSSIQTISFFTAFIMAIHPFLVEAVAWMAASKILLYSFFYLWGLNTYFSYLKSKKVIYLIAVYLLFALSFGAKEQAVTFPACLLLIDYILKRNLKNRAVWLEKIPFILTSLFFCYITLVSQKSNGVGMLSQMKTYPFHQNLIFACYSVTEYFAKCLIPSRLNFIYPFPNPVGAPVPSRFLIYPFLLPVIIVALFDFWKKRWVAFAMIFFVIHLAVVLHIVPISRFAVVADRYAYIASIGVFFLISYYLDIAIRSVKYRNLTVVALVFYLGYLGNYTYRRSKVWHDSDTLKKELNDLYNKRNDFEEKNKK
ncbi:hypothetical protein [Mucilaginibacter sp. UR6-11]|uniref:hypothetical protein n=1 Tax=Mucilaginibacter sp. UR6-11 TaxID=1435644 RepID=UPI001E552744|nr:hypothetical protein [Mucilaginibacter sp. UR6-11]MCC8423847.1 hypothetical protein [Mucilaginibacter sp. UR6-11]